MKPPQLYLITDRFATAGRSLPLVIEDALLGLATHPQGKPRVAVQLRDKDLSGAQLFALANELRRITHVHGAQLFINSRVDVAMACGADGVHVAADALPVAVVKQLAPHLLVAASTHTMSEVSQAKIDGADFVVFGPVFATPSKQGLLQPRGLTALADACSLGVPTIALGGIDIEHASSCVRAGASGVAVIRAVFAAASPAMAALRLADAFA